MERKINFAYPSGGNELIKNAIWDLLELQIDRYIYLDISAFRDIIDVLGGVDFYVPVDMKYDDNAQNLHIDLKQGQQTLSGAQAEQYWRYRHPNSYEDLPEDYKTYYNGDDTKRINAQQALLKEFIRQKATLTNLPKVFKVLDILFDRVKTDFTLDEILDYTYNIDQIDIDRVKMFVISGEGGYAPSGTWYFEYDGKINYKEGIYDTASVIRKYFKSNYSD
jgi:LCP family protein required for cell wall assembly